MPHPSCYTPVTCAEVVDIVAQAVADHSALCICGGGSKRMMRPQLLSGARLDLSCVAGITRYDPDELFLTARAGTSLLEIASTLAERKQMLAFEPFDHAPLFGEAAGRATLGGIVAANVSGPRRLTAGAARDHILGFEAVSGRGEAFKCGGTVVKNVTGYDLPKLMAGSWGTLAVLTTITLRLLPRPQTESTLLLRGLADQSANRAMTRALSLPVQVSCAAHLPTDGALTALRLEGFGPSVQARYQQLSAALQEFCPSERIEAEQSSAFWERVSTLAMLPVAGHVLWRICLPPAIGWQVGTRLSQGGAYCAYDWAGGLLWAALPDDHADVASSKIPELAHAHSGHAALIRAPESVRRLHSRSSASDPGLRALHARVKAAFDPHGILNPGLDLAADL